MLFKLNKQTLIEITKVYIIGVIATIFIALVAVGINAIANYAVTQGINLYFLADFFPYKMYLSGTLIAIFFVGPLGFATIAVLWKYTPNKSSLD